MIRPLSLAAIVLATQASAEVPEEALKLNSCIGAVGGFGREALGRDTGLDEDRIHEVSQGLYAAWEERFGNAGFAGDDAVLISSQHSETFRQARGAVVILMEGSEDQKAAMRDLITRTMETCEPLAILD